jgi:hypothetical protein
VASGTLIGESLRVGAQVDGLTVHRVERVDAGDLSPEQRAAGFPEQWTLLYFDVADEDAGRLAEALAGALAEPGWYADFHTERESFVVFSGSVFRYPRGDAAGRAQAQAHGRDRGVPEAQLDWP